MIGLDLENQKVLHRIIRDSQKDKGAEAVDVKNITERLDNIKIGIKIEPDFPYWK